MEQEEIVLKLSPQEVNLILEGIGSLAFVRVYNLIGKIQAQASSQLGGETSPLMPSDVGDQ